MDIEPHLHRLTGIGLHFGNSLFRFLDDLVIDAFGRTDLLQALVLRCLVDDLLYAVSELIRCHRECDLRIVDLRTGDRDRNRARHCDVCNILSRQQAVFADHLLHFLCRRRFGVSDIRHRLRECLLPE